MEYVTDPLNGRRITDILLSFTQGFSSTEISIRELRDQLSGRIYGMLLLVLALPNLIPLPAPGLSAITGLPLLILSVQLMLGKNTPWFPQVVLNRKIRTEHLQQICTKTIPHLSKLERYVLPRFFWLVHPPADRIIATVCVLLSLLIMLPIPFGNALPALAVCFFSIALLQRDGIFVLAGLACAILSLFVISFFVSAMLAAVLHLWGLQ
jgi:hypothetical protein